VSFDPRWSHAEQIVITRVRRNLAMITEMESEVEAFLAEVDEHMLRLDERAARSTAA
jgi:hypothetical protein